MVTWASSSSTIGPGRLCPQGPEECLALVTLLEVEVRDRVVPSVFPLELGESERLVGFGHSAEEPAWEGSRLEARGKPRVSPVEGEALGFLLAAVELHNVHWLRAKDTAVRGVSGVARKPGLRTWDAEHQWTPEVQHLLLSEAR